MFDLAHLAYFAAFLVSLGIAVAIIGKERLLNPIRMIQLVLVILTLTYFVRPLALELTGTDASLFTIGRRTESLENVLPQMIVAVFLALLFLALGYRNGRKKERKQKRDSAETSLASSNPPLYIYLPLIIALLAYGYITMIAVLPTIGLRSQDIAMLRTTGGSVYTNTTGYITMGHLFIPVACTLLFAITRKPLPAILLSAPWFLNRLYIGWERYSFVTFIIAILVIWYYYRREIHVSRQQGVLLATLGIASVFLLTIMNTDRHLFRENGFSLGTVATATSASTSDLAFTTNFIAGYEATLYLLDRVPEDLSFGYGGMYIYRYLVQPIPRILWSGKPTMFGFPTIGDPIFWGAAPGSIGEAYGGYGFAGIALIFFATGWIIRRVEDGFWRSSRSPILLAAYAGGYASLIQIGRDSFFMMLPQYFMTWGIPLIAAWVLFEIYRRQEQQRIRRKVRIEAMESSRARRLPQASAD